MSLASGMLKSVAAKKKQSGQAIVLILLLTVVGVVGALALISTGIITSKKMQLQNAADATAYSVSVIEARDLNFSAYLNRSMVANEVAIGQMVSLHSWNHMMRSMPEFLDDYAFKIDKLLKAASLILPPVTSPLAGIGSSIVSGVKVVSTPLRTIHSAIYKVLPKFTKPVSVVLNTMNRVYSTSQQVMHFATLFFTADMLLGSNSIKDRNVDLYGKERPEFSPFGYMALAAHYASYYGDTLNAPIYNFVQNHSFDKDSPEGMQRFAQVINDSRDPFTKNRHCEVGLIGVPPISVDLGIVRTTISLPAFDGCTGRAQGGNPSNMDIGGWTATLFGIEVIFGRILTIDIPLIGSFRNGLEVTLGTRIGLERKGGTVLRQGDGNDSDGGYTWTAGDVAAGTGSAWGSFEAYVLGIGGRFGISLEPPNIPFGVGAGLAGLDGRNTPDMVGFPTDEESPGRDNTYGGANSSRQLLGWKAVLPPWLPTPDAHKFVKDVKSQIKENSVRQLNKSYRLNGYQDVSDSLEIGNLDFRSDEFLLGMEAPYILIGLEMDKVADNSSESTGRFELDPPKYGIFGSDTPTTFGVIAKAEVYFSRPKDLDYFLRESKDGRGEKPNAFNPYWDARLVDTSFIDRSSALMFQHGQLPLPPQVFETMKSAQSIIEAVL